MEEFLKIFWLILGIILVVFEFFAPGLVSIFLGAGAILTAILAVAGILNTIWSQLIFFALSSLVLMLLLRNQVAAWFPSQAKVEHFDEAIGARVVVETDVHPDRDTGRVRHEGTSWKAVSTEGIIEAGYEARVTGRENLMLYVAPVEEK